MLSDEFNLDSILDTVADSSSVYLDTEYCESNENAGVAYLEPGYEGSIDPRIRQLSYSSLLTLHSCPRKFQLSRLRSTHKAEESEKSTVTFAFGHVVGEGLASLLEGKSIEDVIFQAFLGWHTDLAAEDEKLKKSFYSAITALQRFASMRDEGFLDEYELVYQDGRPACELSFVVIFPDGFRLRGFVDAVLKHKHTGAAIVLECKTTGSATVNPATYKNSAQAIGYSVVLDVLFPSLSSYEVLYLVYQTKTQEYTCIPFTKSYMQRALWIRELLLDIETIKMYEEAEIYPQRGESCFSFFRECEYMQSCSLSTDYLTKPCTPAEIDSTDYQINLTLEDLIVAQLAKE